MRFIGTGIGAVAPAVAIGAVCVIACSSSASFVSFVVSSSEVSLNGQNLVVYTLAARFDGAHDTVFRAFDLAADSPSSLLGFWHKDNHGDAATNGLLSQDFGTWDPSKTGSTTANRPYDSYLTIGSVARSGNTTMFDGQWYDDNHPEKNSWDRPDLPASGGLGWFNKDSDSGQGTVGNSPGLPQTDVRLGQFVLSAGHTERNFTLSLKWGHEYSLSDDCQYSTDSFTLGSAIPAPGALALLTIAGVSARRRQR